MIDPAPTDVGRLVVYRPRHEPGAAPQQGVITSFNKHYVFVRYGAATQGIATSREDLEWANQ